MNAAQAKLAVGFLQSANEELTTELDRLRARLAEIMPLFVEARDALPAISTASAKLHNVDLSLASRMDAVGTKDWRTT